MVYFEGKNGEIISVRKSSRYSITSDEMKGKAENIVFSVKFFVDSKSILYENDYDHVLIKKMESLFDGLPEDKEDFVARELVISMDNITQSMMCYDEGVYFQQKVSFLCSVDDVIFNYNGKNVVKEQNVTFSCSLIKEFNSLHDVKFMVNVQNIKCNQGDTIDASKTKNDNKDGSDIAAMDVDTIDNGFSYSVGLTGLRSEIFPDIDDAEYNSNKNFAEDAHALGEVMFLIYDNLIIDLL
ncbi:hypothetical protein GUI12_00040 [Anaplasmataceae bacterium AB001_6]|nr:hypothetical protein GUI12_00040 [Anaplasmataceae bacterium AB001_6]